MSTTTSARTCVCHLAVPGHCTTHDYEIFPRRTHTLVRKENSGYGCRFVRAPELIAEPLSHVVTDVTTYSVDGGATRYGMDQGRYIEFTTFYNEGEEGYETDIFVPITRAAYEAALTGDFSLAHAEEAAIVAVSMAIEPDQTYLAKLEAERLAKLPVDDDLTATDDEDF